MPFSRYRSGIRSCLIFVNESPLLFHPIHLWSLQRASHTSTCRDSSPGGHAAYTSTPSKDKSCRRGCTGSPAGNSGYAGRVVQKGGAARWAHSLGPKDFLPCWTVGSCRAWGSAGPTALQGQSRATGSANVLDDFQTPCHTKPLQIQTGS